MGEGPVRENYRMYGLILHHSDAGARGAGVFLKMTGPADVLAGQEATFERSRRAHAVAPGDTIPTITITTTTTSGHDHAEGEGTITKRSPAPADDQPHAGASAMSSLSARHLRIPVYAAEGWEALARA